MNKDKKQRILNALTTAMEKPEIANALIQRVINGLNEADSEWVGLTDEDMDECVKAADYNQAQYKRTPYWAHLATVIEAKLKEKNT